MDSSEWINGLHLIANGLRHIAFEQSLQPSSHFRVAREAHLVLYRSMIEALRGTANLAVTGRLSKVASFRYQAGNGPWLEIHRQPAPNCRKAWRFSNPTPCVPPMVAGGRQEASEERLIGFYEALAMIQTDCFMLHLTISKVVPVDDQSMAILEWLHEDVRNEYEHFVPKSYGAAVGELSEAAALCLRLSKDLLFRSGNVLFSPPEEHSRLSSLFESIRDHDQPLEVM